MTALARRDALVGSALGIGALALYVACLPPTFAFWDTGELQTVAAILGIAHPPACPAFVLLGWLFTRIVSFGEPAWRVNLMCALSVAAAAALLFAAARRCGVPPLTGTLVTLGFLTAGAPWRDATRAEIQDLELLLRAAAIVFALRYASGGRLRDLFVTSLFTGLALATHGIALLLLPALGLCIFARPESRTPRALGLMAGGFALGLLPYGYLPLRSAWIARHGLDPTLRLGLAAGAQPFWDYDHPATWRNFVRVLTAADFNVRSGFAGYLDVTRYPAYAAAAVRRLAAAYGEAGAILAAFGAALLVARRQTGAAALVLAGLLPVPYTEAYKDLQDPERYYLFTLWCAAIALGVGFEGLAHLFALRVRSVGRFALGCALVASLVASSDRTGFFAQRSDRGAERYVAEVVAATPDDAIVVAEWAYVTPLAYAAYVQRRFGARSVVSAAPAQLLSHYHRWLARRPLFIVTFDDDLRLPGFEAEPVIATSYYAYRIAAPRTRAAR